MERFVESLINGQALLEKGGGHSVLGPLLAEISRNYQDVLGRDLLMVWWRLVVHTRNRNERRDKCLHHVTPTHLSERNF